MGEPFLNSNFVVEFLGTGEVGFSEISGIEQYMEVVEYREGNSDKTCKIPGLLKSGKITFKKGMAEGLTIIRAFEDAQNGVKNNIIITINSNDLAGLRKIITLTNAWPCKYSISKLDAITSEVLIEEVEIVFETMTVEES